MTADCNMSQTSSSANLNLNRVIPKNGLLIYEEKPALVMCKPRLIPLKSLTLQKLETMQKEMKTSGADVANSK